MRKASLAVAALVAFGFACGSALAAGVNVENDAAGQEPNMDQMSTTAPATLTRAQVEQGAVQDPPAEGQASGVADPVSAQGTLTRTQVEHAVDKAEVADHGFPDASGNEPAAMQK